VGLQGGDRGNQAVADGFGVMSVGQMDEHRVAASAFMCRSSAERRGASFYEAQGHMVGPCYDMYANGKPCRVLVLPMETANRSST
jgi:hypothetical protein